MDRGAAAGRPVIQGRTPIAALVVAIGVLGCSALPLPSIVEVSIPPGVTPHTAPARIESMTLDLIHDMEEQASCRAAEPRVVRMTLTEVADLPLLEPAAGFQVGIRRGLFAWVVHAEGTFTTRRGRRDRPRPCVRSGYVLFLDRDATVMGMGFP